MKNHHLFGRAAWLCFASCVALACGKGATGPAGKAGPPGMTGTQGMAHEFWIHGTVATPGASSAAPNTFDAGTWGPFNLSGECYLNAGAAHAAFFISSTDPGAKYTNYGDNGYVNNKPVNPTTGPVAVGYYANSTSPTSDLEGPYDGYLAAMSSDLNTYIVGAMTTGTYLNGAAGPACQFDGWIINPP